MQAHDERRRASWGRRWQSASAATGQTSAMTTHWRHQVRSPSSAASASTTHAERCFHEVPRTSAPGRPPCGICNWSFVEHSTKRHERHYTVQHPANMCPAVIWSLLSTTLLSELSNSRGWHGSLLQGLMGIWLTDVIHSYSFNAVDKSQPVTWYRKL